jgi:GABA(A) receptor-associated protein
MLKSYKENFEFAKRKIEAEKILKKYPDRIPIIVEVSPSMPNLQLEKNKYLCPGDLTCGQFSYVIRKRTTINPEQALFIFINNTLPATSSMMKQIYKEHKYDDGFLYMLISEESTFGCS